MAIDDVSFDILPGEVLGVVGESGAGKSVTGTAIIGLIEPPGPHRRRRDFAFRDAHRQSGPPRMRRIRGKRIGMVFQDPLTSLDPLYRIGDQLIEDDRDAHRPAGRGMRDRAVALLTEVGIPAPKQRIDNYPHQFSGGMRQRVVLALALAADPELVIADEPTTALDVSVQAQIIALMKRLAAGIGAAIMLITHDMGVIAETADRVAVMYAGRIAEIGPVRDVMKRAAASLYERPDGLDPDARRRPRPPRPDPRLDAAADRHSVRLPVSSALSACLCALSRSRPELRPHATAQVACWLYHPAPLVESDAHAKLEGSP